MGKTMREVALTIPAVLLAALTGPAVAEHCVTYETNDALVDAGGYYVDWDCFAVILCQTDNMGTVWIYEESNGIPGLQRGDEVYDDTCHSMIRADTIIF